jgi:hypothetical protein
MVPGGGVEPPRAEAWRIFIPSMAFAAQTWSSFKGSRQVCGFLNPLGMWGLHGRISPLLEGGLQHLPLVTTTSVQESLDVKPIGYA